MGWNPFRRRKPTGRHCRPVYPTVPGAAATIVAVAAVRGTPPAPLDDHDAALPAVAAPRPPLEPAVAPLTLEDLDATQPLPYVLAAPSELRESSGDLGWPVGGSAPVGSSGVGAVGLVFADGGSLELAADDPRVDGLRTAAAALLDVPSA